MSMESMLHPVSEVIWLGSNRETLKAAQDAFSNGTFKFVFKSIDEPVSNPSGSIIVVDLDLSDLDDFAAEDDVGIEMERISVLKSVLQTSRNCVVVCIASNASAQSAVDWIEEGASFFVDMKYLSERFPRLLERVVDKSTKIQSEYNRYERLKELWSAVTGREAAVLEMILDGVPNKTIATRLGVSQRTIEARRQKLYHKLGARSLPGVVKTICELERFDEHFNSPRTVDFSKVAKSAMFVRNHQDNDDEQIS